MKKHKKVAQKPKAAPKSKVQVVVSASAPAAVGPYSQAIQYGGFLFLSGQIALDPHTGVLKGETIAEQTQQVLRNIEGLLRSKGLTISSIVKTTVFLTSLSEWQTFNSVYEKFMKSPFPARSTVEVSRLPKGALVEIECIAAC